MSTPIAAPRPVPTMMGVANPRAHEQAMIKTATAATSPPAASTVAHQPTNVAARADEVL